MRVLQVHTRYREPGGEDVVVDADAALLRAAGHEVEQHLAENGEGGARAGAQLLAAPWNPRAAAALRAAAASFRPDVVHVHNTWFAMGPLPVRAAAGLGVPVVATLHNYRMVCAPGTLYRDSHPCQDCVGTHPWRGVVHRCYRGSAPASAMVAVTLSAHRRARTWDRVGRFLALTEFAKRVFVAGGLPADRVSVRSNSAPDPGPRAAPPSASRSLLFVGRLSPEKGVDVLVEGWRRSRLAGHELVVVGDGPLRPSLEALGAPDVRFLGQQPPEAVRSLMLEGRALLMPSQVYEGQGLVLLEAMAAGLPTVVTDHGALPETVGADAGSVVPVGDPEGWASAVARLADDERVDERGRFGRARYVERYTPEVGLRTLLEAYEGARAATARS